MSKLPPDQRQRRWEMQKILYRLTRRYGVKVSLYKFEQGTFDPETGKTTGDTRTKVDIRHFVSWDVESDFVIFGSREFGATYETGDRIGIINSKELPSDFVMDQSYYIVIDGKRYNTVKYNELAYKAGFMLQLRRVQSQEPHQSLELIRHQQLTIQQDITGTL